MEFRLFIGLKNLFARARVPAYETLHELIAMAMVFAFSILAGISNAAEEPHFVHGLDSRIHAIASDRTLEEKTREKMHISENCGQIKPHTSAIAFVGSDGARLIPHIKSTRGLLVLEGLREGAEPKVLSSQLLGDYNAYPRSLPGDPVILPALAYPLTLTLAATLAGSGDLIITKDDYVIITAARHGYAYHFPDLTIPNEGVLKLYLGTDDTLYYDAALTHPVHSGECRRAK